VIDALVAGRLHGKPAERTAKNGLPFATAKVRVATRDGEALFVGVIAFERPVVAALLELSDKDAVALAGELTASAWSDKEGKPRPALDLVVHQLVSPYNVGRKRKAMQQSSGPAANPLSGDLLDDPLPEFTEGGSMSLRAAINAKCT
jgi:single-stranded DNA-binding protein